MTFQVLEKSSSGAVARDCGGRGTVLCIQDSCSLSFPTARHTTGLGPVTNNSEVLGLHVHSALAAREDGVPIGLLHQYVWSRDPEPRSPARRKKQPIEEKESFKWIRAMGAAREVLAEQVAPGERPRLIHVGDCENDVHEVLEDLLRAGESMVIRSGQNRRARDGGGAYGYAHQLVRRAPLLGTATVEVPRKRGRPRREATIELRARRLTLAPRSPHHPERGPLTLTLVEAWESAPPQGVQALHWLLWTDEPARNVREILRVIDIYKKRWKIEEVHLALKSGCRIEDVRFETAERIAKAIALYSPVAVRIVALRDLARLEPEAPSTQVLRENEWRALWTYIHKRPPAAQQRPPTLRQAALWIARIGGHLGRKSDGMPGVRTLWRGWRDLALLAELYRSLAP